MPCSRASRNARLPLVSVLAALTLAACSGPAPHSPTCSDGDQNGTETGVDCGGSTCPRCAIGVGCSVPGDCEDGVCTTGTCAAPSCPDGVKNGVETGLDCGGATSCVRCPDGQGCTTPADCESAVCSESQCVPPSCIDETLNAQETAVDCGGPSCLPCATGLACDAGPDCRSGLCEGNLCVVRTQGEACGSAAQCASGFCADGFCCDGACGGACEACSLPGAVGTCSFVPAATDPADECTASAASTCGTTGVCDGAGACALHAAGTGCAPAVCAGSIATSASLCDGTGSCVSPVPQSCAPYTCGPSACKTSCASGGDCATNYSCAAGACKLVQGQPCVADVGCASGFCTDGVCCEARCGGTCERCNQAGRAGFCDALPAGADSGSECPASAAATCGTSGLCNGARACALHPGGTACAPASCTGSTATVADTCDGFGSCVDAGLQSCSPYVCGTTACKSTCTGDADCVTGFWCSGSSCEAKLAQGSACANSSECASGSCVDGFCCDTTCTGDCRACSAAKSGGANGSCAVFAAGTDPDNECAGSCDGAGACAP